ncbi:MAG: outer membrane protein OmpA-like peptidoglycan-associated protein [Lentisphaeria bacterium]|jgi:outer membrane protein OmpA-like peptidoglycan-associated protein
MAILTVKRQAYTGIVFCLCTFISSLVHAQVAPFADLFEDQRTLYSSPSHEIHYRLTLGPLRKINGVWVAEREELVYGRLARRTIEIDRIEHLDILWLEAQSYFNARDARIIYECAGLDCGSSNAWANTRFQIKQLYGLDVQQHYQVLELNQGSARYFVVFYMVQRGNHRIYAQLDTLLAKNNTLNLVVSPGVLAKEIYSKGEIEVTGLTFSEGAVNVDKKYIQSLARALNEQPFKKLLIVGYDNLAGDEQQQNQRALSYAQTVGKNLIDAGVSARRVQMEGLGLTAGEQGPHVKVKLAR